MIAKPPGCIPEVFLLRELLIFGNGLGRAIDNDFFNLTRALNASWDDPEVLSDRQKALIRQCLPEAVVEENDAPSGEDDLALLQRILAACDLINEVERRGEGKGWLSKTGKAFPDAIRRYIHRAACEFHDTAHELPEDFATPLRDHILKTKSHVATLNYDKLLYENFIGTDVFHGYECLIDGFIRGTFDAARLQRQTPRKTSYYLHLHGSPLFHDDKDGSPCKARIPSLQDIAGNRSAHIVLTNVAHKESVIAASPVLSAYWQRLDEVLEEVTQITVLGYSGLDIHLNRRIRTVARRRKLPIHVVERKGDGTKAARQAHWDDTLGAVTLHRPKCLLDFTGWGFE